MESHVLHVDGLDIAVTRSTGCGPPVVLVHGNSASARAFGKQLDGPLGAHLHLVAIDLPGHGHSQDARDPAATYGLPGYARIVAGVAGQLDLAHAVFAGWSLGGHVVLEASPALPQAAGFLIFGTPPLGVPPAMDAAFFASPALQAVFAETLTDSQYDAWLRESVTDPDGRVPALFHADARRTDGRARAHLAQSIGPGGYRDEVSIVAHLRQPLAILHGERERVVRIDYLRGLNIPALWRGAVQVIGDAGHAPQWEQPAAFDALLEAFVADVTAAPAPGHRTTTTHATENPA